MHFSRKNYKPSYNFSNKNCKPSHTIFLTKFAKLLIQFFWKNLKTSYKTTNHFIIFVVKIANLPMTHNYPSPLELGDLLSCWPLSNQLSIFIIAFFCCFLHITQCGTLVTTHLTRRALIHFGSNILFFLQWNPIFG